MNPNLLAIIIAFYLSKFDKQGLKNLGYKNDADAFESISKALGIKKNYIKFRRDEFDPIHPWRKGWQRPMDLRIKKAIDALQDMSELDLREIVLKIINDQQYRTSDEVETITDVFSKEKKTSNKGKYFILRAPTGKAAEAYFLEYFNQTKKPIEGNLIDCRDFGVGYDFRIEKDKNKYYVEVKGVSEYSGGILFTSKEWTVAKKEGKNYFLCIISNLKEQPNLIFIQNPAEKLNPKKNIFTSVQVSWSVTQNQLSEIK